MHKIFSILTFSILFVGCGTLKAPVQPSKQAFTFDYTPKTSNAAGSAGMVLAFLKPYYAKSFAQGTDELFQNFQSALGSDMEELIIAKGFTMKGPYLGYDEMVFEDKKRVDMAIMIEIAPVFTAADGGWKEHVNLLNRQLTYTYEGTVSLVGKINITGVEPLTNEKIWSKSVLIPNVENIRITTSKQYPYKLSDAELVRDASVYNAIGKALQAQYSGIMDKVFAHFNVEEFNTLKGQVKELKSKKGF
jgi:hypothetical protein